MSGLIDKFMHWAAPRAFTTGWAQLACALGHRDRQHDCLERRQGRCPGIEFCHDCAWTEGMTRQAPR